MRRRRDSLRYDGGERNNEFSSNRLDRLCLRIWRRALWIISSFRVAARNDLRHFSNTQGGSSSEHARRGAGGRDTRLKKETGQRGGVHSPARLPAGGGSPQSASAALFVTRCRASVYSLTDRLSEQGRFIRLNYPILRAGRSDYERPSSERAKLGHADPARRARARRGWRSRCAAKRVAGRPKWPPLASSFSVSWDED
jgi:hypothetical protein